MPTPKVTAKSTADRYFDQAAKLRWCLEQNLDDHAHAERGGRIVYLMDANVVRFFLDPERDQHLVAAFGNVDKDDYAAATALVTAEYVFSRALPGQAASPALIAPAHGDDIQDVLNGLEKHNPPISSEPLDPAATALLSTLVDDVRAARIDRSTAIRQLRKLVPSLATHLLKGRSQAAHQLLRLYDDDLLRPLALHPTATHDILEIRENELKRKRSWVKRLRKEHPHGRSRYIERDAEVLVQTMILDAAAMEEKSSTRYVLLTADAFLLNAYVRWFWEKREDEDPQARFVLRSLLQYAPIFNVQDMPNGVTRSDVIQRARDALDGLFNNTPALRQGYPQKLAYYRLLADDVHAVNAISDYYGVNPLSFDNVAIEAFRATRRIWLESFRNGVVLNAELMRRRLTEEFELLAHLLRDDADLLTALHEEQRRIMDRVLAAHASLTTGHNVRLLRGSDGSATKMQRAPLILRKGFGGILGHLHLKESLNRIASDDAKTIRLVNEALLKVPIHEAYFFAACVAHRCGHWEAARLYAQRALAHFPQIKQNESDRIELIYVHASAIRYEFSSAQAVCRAFSEIEAMVVSCREQRDYFGLVRALAEASSLLLAALYRSSLTNDAVACDVIISLEEQLLKLGTFFAEAHDGLNALAAPDPDLLLHTSANIISTEVYAHFLQGSSGKVEFPDRTLLQGAKKNMGQTIKLNCHPPILLLELVMARLASHEITAEEATTLLWDAGAFSDDVWQNTPHRLDQNEFRHFAALLSQLGAPARVASKSSTEASVVLANQ